MLIYSRGVFGGVIIALAILKPHHSRLLILTLIGLGLLSDIFDGIIARKLNISTSKLRRMDSNVDQFFWFCVVAGAYILSPGFFKTNLVLIIILLSAEAACYILSFLKFKKEVATHAVSSKIWVLLLFATLIQVIATGNSVLLFYICFYVGIATRVEIISILLILRQWTNDIPSVFHAVALRKGKNISGISCLTADNLHYRCCFSVPDKCK